MAYDMSETETKYERLTVKIIKERFWDPVIKKGKPITFFYEYNHDHLYYGRTEVETLTPTGNLLDENGDIIKDWLSKPGDGPYNSTNSDNTYYIEFDGEVYANRHDDDFSNFVRIEQDNIDDNYLIIDDVQEGMDCLIEKKQ